VALDPQTGDVVWQSPGEAAAYASFIVATLGGVPQIVGYDAHSLGGWDLKTGDRLWQLIPPQKGDFNVPTPIDASGKLLVASENNGTRLYDFDSQGRIIPRPVAENEQLVPNASTPILLDGKVYGCYEGLFCLDLADGLRTVWSAKDPAFDDYAALLGSGDRVLVVTCGGELLLVRAGSPAYELVSRLQVFPIVPKRSEVYSHPALVGSRLYLRDSRSACCLDLGPPAAK